MKQQELSVLSNVIAVARRELADRDDDEISARMRPVAKRGGGRLVVPLQRSLIKYIQTSETFREAVLERWESEGVDDAIGLGFLKDPESGINKVRAQAESRDLDAVQADLERAGQTIQSLESQIAEAKSRLADASTRHNEELAKHDAAAAAARVSLDGAVAGLNARIVSLEEAQDTHTGVVTELDAEIDDLTDKLTRSTARASRKARTDHVRVRQLVAPPSDPFEFAGWLDTVEKQQRSFREARGVDADAASDQPLLRVPAGLQPDSREALSAVIEQRPDVVYIDGYNVGAMLTDGIGTAKSRRVVVSIADRLASAARGRVVVVFDAVGVEGRKRVPSPGRAEVRFSLTQIADDEIVEMIRANPSRAVVITSDRELSDRCAAEGCATVWSEALVQWANR
jgi:prefoldin subunit 5